MAKNPLVSIVTITYNHERFIAQALDSFLMQETNFAFEIIVADDASTDETQKIIADYAKKYPEIIKPILRKQNIGAVNNSLDSLRAASGDFIALCEGDDYWTNPNKLQRQVDFFASHPDYAVCFHPVVVVTEGNTSTHVFPESKPSLTIANLLKQNFIQTNSVMYRRQDYSDMPTNVLPLDWYLHVYHAQFGKIGYLDQSMSAYRKHEGGIWWNANKNIDEIWRRHGLSHLALYVAFRNLYASKPKLAPIISQHIEEMLNVLVEVQAKYGGDIITRVAAAYPELMAELVLRKRSEIIKGHQEIIGVLQALKNSEHDVEEITAKLRAITNSRVWRTRNKVSKKLGRGELS